MRRPQGRGCARRARRPGLEPLELRNLPAVGFGPVIGIGSSGQYASLKANAEAEDASGNIIVVGSIVGSAPFNTGGGAAVTLSNTGNQDAYIAEFTSAGALVWAETFPGQTGSTVAQASAVAVDSSGNIEVAGTFNGTIKVGSTTMTATSMTDLFVAKLNGSGQVQWVVQSVGTTYKNDTPGAIVPDGSGGAYLAGSYMGTMTLGSTSMTAVGSSEAFAAHVSSSGSFAWAVSTTGSPGSGAGMTGLAVDPSGRLVMSGYYYGTVNFNPSGSTSLTGAGSYDVVAWVLNSDGSLGWAEGFGGANYDQADAVAVDSSGNVYVTGAFSGTVNFNPSGTALNLTTPGSYYNTFVLKLSSTGSTVWADTFADANGSSIGNGLGVDPSGRVIAGGWFIGTTDFDPGSGTTSVTSAGAQDAFVVVLDGSGNLVGVATGGGSGTDEAFGLAVGPSGAIATAGTYTGPSASNPSVATTFGSTSLSAAGSSNIFVATLSVGGVTLVAPSAPALEAASDSGSSSADGITNVTAPTFDIGGVAAGVTVQLLRDGAVVASRVGAGAIADPGRVPDGSHQYTAREVDASNNPGPASSATTITIDTTAPASPPAPVLLAADDSGAAGDGLTNVKQPRLTGSAEAGSTVTLRINGAVVGTGTATGGTYTIQLTSALADGAYSITATATDAAGNASPAGSAFSLTIDTTAPARPTAPALSAQDDSGALGDGITNVKQPRLTGTAEAGGTVRLYAGATLIGTGTATGGSYSIQVTSPLLDGAYSIMATATDAAGNVSAASTALALTIDTTAPAAPAAPSLLAADDSGAAGDGLTNVAAPRITGSAEAGATVRLYAGSTLVGTGTAANGSYSIQVSSPLADGAYSITATATDAAGNVGAASSPFSLTIDTTAPAAPPSPSLLAADDSGSLGDGLTNVKQPRIVGSAEAGATVRLYAGATLIGTGTAAGGSYAIRLTSAMTDGTYAITATATDAAGNTGAASQPFTLTIDTTAPASPTISALASADDSGTVGDGITRVTQPRLTGTAEAGSTVTLWINGAAVGSGPAIGGSYTIAPGSALADGTYSITATATDAAGNVSTSSLAFSLTIDTTAPARPAAPGLVAADDSGALGDGITNISAPRVTGSAEAGSIVRVYSGAALLGTATAIGGAYTVALPGLADGAYSLTITATDAAGNVSAASTALALTIDTTAPAAPAAPSLLAADDSGAAGDGLTNVASPRITGSAEAGATVRLYAGSTLVGTGTATAGSYSIQVSSPLADGTYAITATATDAAGNVGAASLAFSLTIDTATPNAPSTPALLAADDSGKVGDGITSVKQPRLTGSAPDGMLVRLYAGGVLLGSGTSVGGTYTIQPGSALADGKYSITATATDAAGNASPASPPFALTIQSNRPAAPTLTLMAADDTGVKGDGVTRVHAPRVSGVAAPGSVVQLLDASGNVIASTTASTPGGSYTIATPFEAAGTFTYRTQAVDATGVVGVTSAPTTFRIVATQGDYDGDGKADVMTFDPSTAVWTIRSSSTGAITRVKFGVPGALAVPADYDGDGKTDLAVFVPTSGLWMIRDSSNGQVIQYQFGAAGFVPIPGDYLGMGRAQPAVYLAATAQWVVLNPTNFAALTWTFGIPGQTNPVPADYAGYGRDDLAFYNQSTGDWYSTNTTNWALLHTVYGGAGFLPTPADYDGDGKADVAVYQQSTAHWFIIPSTGKPAYIAAFGGANVDWPVPLDYDGDGKADLAISTLGGPWFAVYMTADRSVMTPVVGPTTAQAAQLPTIYTYVLDMLALSAKAALARATPAAATAGGAASTPAPTPAATAARAVPSASPAPILAPSTPRGTLAAQLARRGSWFAGA